MKQQVLVVGAGPVGLTMAAELARYGVAVRIVDKAAQRTDKSKALVLWSRTLELLERAGCAASFVAAGQKVYAANIIAGRSTVGHIDITGVKSPYPYALMLPQSETERLLEEHLQNLGVAIERQVELTSFSQSDYSVTGKLRRADGSEEDVEAEWLIGCDGAHSAVRHQLGLTFAGDTLQSDWILADIHLKGYPYPESEIATYWHEDGVLVFFPISPGRFRVIADVGGSDGSHPADPTIDQINAIMNRRGPGGMEASDPIWLSAFRINERKVADYRSKRVFVTGDAAHVHSPAGGQGMNTGMQDAFNLAWKLALVCRRTCSEALLKSYSAERSSVGEQVLKAAGRLTAIGTLKNHGAQHVRNVLARLLFGLGPVRRAMVDTMTEVSIGYPDSPLNGPARHGIDGPHPGERMPPAAGEMPVGSGSSPRFALFADSSEAIAALTREYEALLEPQIRPSLRSDAIWLVRPDGYVGSVAKKGSEREIADYLRACIG
jgi:2-polyprenyl-6-methoxyphenol hydroxylase-like FAD-dependent oxidoreductase